MNKKIDKKSLQYLQSYMAVTKEVQDRIFKHCKKYNLAPQICAYYSNWEDFCSDWYSTIIGYTRTEARALCHGGKGEFLTFNTGEIIRFVI